LQLILITIIIIIKIKEYKIVGPYDRHVTDKFENFKERDILEDLGLDGKLTFKRMSITH
jgi:hypothetical protein